MIAKTQNEMVIPRRNSVGHTLTPSQSANGSSPALDATIVTTQTRTTKDIMATVPAETRKIVLRLWLRLIALANFPGVFLYRDLRLATIASTRLCVAGLKPKKP